MKTMKISDEAYQALEKIVEDENNFYKKMDMDGFTISGFVEMLIVDYQKK